MNNINNNISFRSLFLHIALFIIVEILFVLIVFREFPAIDLYTTIWIAHLVYWSIVLLCSFWREKAKTIYTRTLALWTPMVVHLGIHIWIWIATVEEHSQWHEHEHHSDEIIWLVIWTLVAWGLIYVGEKLIHKHQHCTTHHNWVHKNCIEEHHWACEWECKK